MNCSRPSCQRPLTAAEILKGLKRCASCRAYGYQKVCWQITRSTAYARRAKACRESASRRWISINVERRRLSALLNAHITAGTQTKPTRCQQCKLRKKLNAWDMRRGPAYFVLVSRWLCWRCWWQAHRDKFPIAGQQFGRSARRKRVKRCTTATH